MDLCKGCKRPVPEATRAAGLQPPVPAPSDLHAKPSTAVACRPPCPVQRPPSARLAAAKRRPGARGSDYDDDDEDWTVS